MLNFYFTLTLTVAAIICSFYIFRDNLTIYFFMGLLVVGNGLYWILSKEHKIISYLKSTYPDFYKRNADAIGAKGWKKNLEKKLLELNDERVNNFLKNMF